MNIYRHELRAAFASAMIWIISLSAITIMYFLIFTAFTRDTEVALSVLGNLPDSVLQALSISFETFFSVYGFFGYLLNFILLAGAIQAMNLGVGVLAKDEIDKTTDFLLTKPVSRERIITAKLLAALTIILLTNLVFGITAGLSAALVAKNDLNIQTFMLISLSLLIVQVVFLAIGLITSQLLRRVKSVVAVSLPVVFSFFIIGMLGAVIGSDTSRYISPFKYFDYSQIISTNSYELRYLAVGLCIVMVSVPLSYWIFIKKDIRATS